MTMSSMGPGTRPCPYCGAEMECDEVDVGPGCVQCGPYHCDECGASEIGPEGTKKATKEEAKKGFYKGRHSPYANTVNGVLVDHHTAKRAYEAGILDNKPGEGDTK